MFRLLPWIGRLSNFFGEPSLSLTTGLLGTSGLQNHVKKIKKKYTTAFCKQLIKSQQNI